MRALLGKRDTLLLNRRSPRPIGRVGLAQAVGGKRTRLGGTQVVASETASIVRAKAVNERQRVRTGPAMIVRPVKSLNLQHTSI
jgi:hypothetical protein